MSKRFTYWIVGGMILGAVVGYILYTAIPDPKAAALVGDYFSIITDLFLRLIKMIIAPLVFSMLVVGIAHMGDTESIGRIGLKAMGWFICASLVSLTLGLVMVNILRPGDNLNLPLPDASTSTNLKVSSLTLKEFVVHMVPRSIVEAMANNEILQIVVFSIFTGVAVTALGEKGRQLVTVADEVAHVMLKITNYVMLMAPLAVFAAVAGVVTTQGLGIFVTYGKFVGGFYLCLVILWVVLIAAGYVFFSPRVIELMRYIREPFLLAFSTASSEAAYPKTVEQLERFGIPNRIVSFVLPLGYLAP